MTLYFTNGLLTAMVELDIRQDADRLESVITVKRIGFCTSGDSLGTVRARGSLLLGDQKAAWWEYFEGNNLTTCYVLHEMYDYIQTASAYHSAPVTIRHDGQTPIQLTFTWSLLTYSYKYEIASDQHTREILLPAIVKKEATRPVLSGPVTLGDTLQISLTPTMEGMVHSLSCRAAGVTLEIGEDIPGGVKAWTADYALAGAFPTMTEGVGEILCRTYLDGEQIGQEECTGFSFVVPENERTKPVVESFNLEPVALEALPEGLRGLYIQNVTRLEGSISAKGEFSPIREYRLAGNGVTSEASFSSPVSGFASVSGPVTVLGRVTDQRGFQGESAREIYVYAYSDPTLAPAVGSAVICGRCNSQGDLDDNGSYLLIRARKVCSSIAWGGEERNHGTLSYRVKEYGADFGQWVTVPEGEEGNYRSRDTILNPVHSYVVQLRVVDSVGRIGLLEKAISSDFVTLHLKRGGKGAALFKRAERDGVFEIAGNVAISTGKTMKIGDTELTEAGLAALLGLLERGERNG